MKELDSFTVERLEELAVEEDLYNFSTIQEELNSLARIALAAKRAEPVGYWNDACDLDDGAFSYANDAGCTRPLYTTPQLNSQVPLGSWIKCSDCRPERGTDVQVYCSDTREQFVAFHIGNGEFQYAQHEDTSIACRPSHWMPLLAAPEKPL